MRPVSHPSIGKVGSAHSTCTIWWCSLRASCMGDVRAAHARSLRVRTCSPAMWGSLGLIPVAGERRSVVVVAVGRCNHTARRFRCEGEATRCPVEGASVCSLAADRCAGVDSPILVIAPDCNVAVRALVADGRGPVLCSGRIRRDNGVWMACRWWRPMRLQPSALTRPDC